MACKQGGGFSLGSTYGLHFFFIARHGVFCVFFFCFVFLNASITFPASNAFRVRDIKHSLNVFRRVAEDLISVIDSHVGQELDFQTLFASATLSGFTEAALSLKICDVSFKESEFAFHFNRLLATVNSRFTNPLFKLMPWCQSERQLRESSQYLDKLAYDAIAQARKRDDTHPQVFTNKIFFFFLFLSHFHQGHVVQFSVPS